MRYDDDLDAFEPDGGFDGEPADGSGRAPWEESNPRRLTRRERRRKRKLEEKLRRLEEKEGGRGARSSNDGDKEEPRRPSRLAAALTAFMTGNILSSKEATKSYPYLIFIAFLAFLYIGNIFSMQRLHRRQAVLTREVRELRTKSMTIASQCMQATRQSNIIREIDKRGIPLKESLEPNRVIPTK